MAPNSISSIFRYFDLSLISKQVDEQSSEKLIDWLVSNQKLSLSWRSFKTADQPEDHR